MKKVISIFLFTAVSLNAWAQADKKGLCLLHFSVGPSFANFIHSEAPHKINIYGSDIYPVIVPVDVTTSFAYFDYETNFINDTKTGLTFGVGLEYYFKNNLSIISSIHYEEKGIHLKNFTTEVRPVTWEAPPESLGPSPPPGSFIYYDETFEVIVKNNYLTLPVLLRKYIHKQEYYLQGGFYLGYLLNSKISYSLRKHTYIPDYIWSGSDTWARLDNAEDEEKEFTMNFDYGVSAGAGLSHPLGSRTVLTADLLFTMGLRQVDAKYNNEYSEKDVISGTGFRKQLRSTNYFGLNSNARNFTTLITVGIGYRL